jgi:IclR family pca regulon transcriptional regulator
VAAEPDDGSKVNDANPNHRIYTISGLLRGLALLEVLGAAGRPMKLAEIAKRLGTTRGVTYRLLYTLKDGGYIQEPSDKLYEVSPRILRLGFSYLRSLGLVRLARRHLEQLADRTQSTVFLAVLDGRDIVYLDKVRAPGQASLDIDVGDRVPAHATAMGRVLLAALSSGQLAALYPEETLPAHLNMPAMSRAAFEAELARVRAQGFALSFSTLYKGVASVAAPIRDRDGRIVAAINSTVLEGAVDRATLEGAHRQHAGAAAAAISSDLGYVANQDRVG